MHKCADIVIPAGKRVSSAMDGKLRYVLVTWIPAIPAGMTGFETLVYNDEGFAGGDLTQEYLGFGTGGSLQASHKRASSRRLVVPVFVKILAR